MFASLYLVGFNLTRIAFTKIEFNRIKLYHMTGGTPVNPRVFSLRTPGANQRAANSPHTTAAAAARGDKDKDELFNSFNSSDRDKSEKVLDQSISDTGTPETKRGRWEDDERNTPEYARTPYLLEQKRQWLEERRNRYKPTESEKRERENTKKSTVSDICPMRESCGRLADRIISNSKLIFGSRGSNTSAAFGRKLWAMATKARANVTRPTLRHLHR